MKKTKHRQRIIEIMLLAMIAGSARDAPDSSHLTPAALDRYAREVCHG